MDEITKWCHEPYLLPQVCKFVDCQVKIEHSIFNQIQRLSEHFNK